MSRVADTPVCRCGRALAGGLIALLAANPVAAQTGSVEYNQLHWASYLGGSMRDEVMGLAITVGGDVYVTGKTESLDYPTTPGVIQPTFDDYDPIFNRIATCVSRLTPDGTLLAASYFGGPGVDTGALVLPDRMGGVLLIGRTSSQKLPGTAGAWDPSYNGGSDVYVSHVRADLSGVEFSTYLGGSGTDFPFDVIQLLSGDLVIVGSTQSPDFPTTNGAFMPSFLGASSDAFIARLSSDGTQLIASTYLGGSGSDLARAVGELPDGRLVVAGTTSSSDFPTTGHYAPSAAMFISVLSPDLTQLLHSRVIDGDGADGLRDLAVGPDGCILIAGHSGSNDLPTTPGVYKPITPTQSGVDSYVGCLESDLSIRWFTYVGGVTESWLSLHVDSAGIVTLAGVTDFGGYPSTDGAWQESIAGTGDERDYYVSRLSPDGARLLHSTYLGGDGPDEKFGVSEVKLHVDARGTATVASTTRADDFPTTPGAAQESYGGGPADGVVARIDLLPTGVSLHGHSTPGCRGPLRMDVTAMPRIGKIDFGLYCTGAPTEGGPGLLLVSRSGLDRPVNFQGADLWIDPLGMVNAIPVTVGSLGVGYSELPLRVPNTPGLVAWLQYAWADPCAPGGVATSHALRLEIQP